MKSNKDISIFNKVKIFSALILSLACSCLSENKISQHQDYQKLVRKFNNETNKYCSSIGLSVDEKNPIRSEMFYRCKTELIQQTRIQNPKKPEDIIFNKNVEKYIDHEKIKYTNSVETLNDYKNSLISNNHHKICTKRGFNARSLRQEEIEHYMTCRKSLTLTFNTTPPYGNIKNLSYNQNSYNTGFIINKEQDIAIKAKAEFAKKYPLCSRYRVNSDVANQCQRDYDLKRSCINNMKRQSFMKRKKYHESCQQKLYAKLPDSLLIDDELDDTDKKKNFNTDLYLNSSFYEFLSDKEKMSSFMAKANYNEDEEELLSNEDQKESLQQEGINNSFNKMYTKAELTSLRRIFIKECNVSIEPKINNFVKSESRNCNDLTTKWENKKI